ncbi:hypothetical protein S40293_05264 [Stachybotrys chartarum IBT 40293]|nr:hypothetical protein S40293_05264 [Stachybotrys chartarum IBT 40293]
MADLLLQAHPGSSIRLKPANISSRLQQKPTQHKKETVSSDNVVGVITRTLGEANDLWLWCKDGMTPKQRVLVQQREERRRTLCDRMKEAQTLKQWQDAAQELDALEGHDEWKKDDASSEYNQALIEQRLQELDQARTNGDLRAMMHILRTALSRDLGGMGNVDLYRHSYIGSKKLIERYVESALETVNTVISQGTLGYDMDHRDLLEGMLYARQSFGRSALLLSGGGTFGMSHIGVVKSLFEARLLPRIISGASAGSIVSAVLCTKSDDEVPEMLHSFPFGDLAVFEASDSKDGVLDHLRRLLTEGSWSDIKHLTRVMRELTGDLTFQEAYNRTRRILNICVSTESIYELPRLLNYITAPNVMIWSAVAASCSVPLIFNASPLLAKDPITGEHCPWNPTPHHFIDGSVDNDLPMTRLSEMFNVNHFIVSQVNPHVVPFLDKNDHLSPELPVHPQIEQPEELDWGYTLTMLAKEEAMHRLHFMAEIGFFPNLATKFRSILSQKYSGDITILPQTNVQDLPRVLTNPTPEFMQRSCLAGERATWPKLGRIRNQCAIELALDRAVHQLRTRVVFSESQRDLRRLSTSASSVRLRLPMSTMSQLPRLCPSPDIKKQGRHRTRSGGSLQAPPDRRMLLGGDITDDDTAEEERQEMKARQGRAASPHVPRKPRLKRASKSHSNIAHQRLPHLTAGQTEPAQSQTSFDFSKPLTPPSQRGRRTLHDDDFHKLAIELTDSVNDWPRDQEQMIEQVMSPTEDMGTSVPDDHSSEAEGEQGTDESDPESVEKHTEPAKPPKIADLCGKQLEQVHMVSEGLWD